MSKWIAEVLVLAISASTLTPLEAAETDPKTHPIIQEVETSYKKGEYDIFLEQLHEQYEAAGQAGVLQGVFESARTAIVKAGKDKELQEHKEDLSQIDTKRDNKLAEAVAGAHSGRIVHEVQRVLYHKKNPEAKAALDELHKLRYHIPETTDGTVENKISALETEYYIKSLLLDIGNMRSGSSKDELEKKKLALSLAKFDRMSEVAKERGSQEWQGKIAAMRLAFIQEKSYKLDLKEISRLATGERSAKNPVEEKVKHVMIDDQKERQLSEESFAAAQK